ncbi:MAG TPA: tetratricopeptide repeat protein [Candidatus Limnocylindria bacterium]|nr:tetratricopeptide repeat protein [Candidatus Limnocylindria bacterium]
MRVRVLPWMFVSIAVCAAPAFASFSGGSRSDPPPPTSPPASGANAQAQTPRQEAEQIYALAYEEVAKAKQDLAAGKTKNAEKKLKRALERGERAVALDAKYHEAWNLVGYSARKLGNYEKAFAAYEKCLELKPDYAPAREYLGEAWLDRGDPVKARQQLVLLEKYNAADEAKDLKAQIDAYEAAHPPAAADSSSAASGGR